MTDLTTSLLDPKTFEKRLDFFMKVQLWDSEKQEMAAAIRTLHRLLATAKAEGAAEALRSLADTWHHYSGHITLPEAFPRPCSIGCTKCFILAEAKSYDERAAALRKQVKG